MILMEMGNQEGEFIIELILRKANPNIYSFIRLKRVRSRPNKLLLIMNTNDQEFLTRAKNIVAANMDNIHFNASDFSNQIYISRSQLHRKLVTLTGKSTTEFIRHQRLQKAAQLLRARNNSISSIVYTVGFNNLSYFTKCFKATFGVLPSQYCKSEKMEL